MFRSILWSYQLDEVDLELHKHIIIVQAINYGTLDHWRWIAETYGKETVRRVLREIPVTSIRGHVRKLVMLLFDINEDQFNYASRGTDR